MLASWIKSQVTVVVKRRISNLLIGFAAFDHIWIPYRTGCWQCKVVSVEIELTPRFLRDANFHRYPLVSRDFYQHFHRRASQDLSQAACHSEGSSLDHHSI